MKYRDTGMLFRTITVLAAAAVFVIGCAQVQAPPESAPAETADSDVEEMVVTGNRPGSSDGRASRPSLATLSRQYGSASDVMGFSASTGGSRLATLADASSDEELWVIATPTFLSRGMAPDSSPGSGAMLANDSENLVRDVPLPLQHTEVNARIDGYIGTVSVRQQFTNPFDTKIEAVYLFPLPEKSAVSEFLMIIGERKIRGILREKEEAEAIYREARAQGYQASLLLQHRPNVFEQKVANIEPGKSIDVDIRYFHTLAYNDGWYSFVFPTVVGPRYNPPGHDNPISAAPRGASGGSQTTATFLGPDERSGHDISISVEIDAGVEIEELKSTHKIVANRTSPQTASVALADQATIPNRDFVLDFRVSGETIKSNLMTYVDPATQQGYFTMMLYPPSVTESLARQPMEMVFVLDCSGSMSGRPLEQAKDAVAAALDRMQEGDTFQIIRFSEDSTQLGDRPLSASGPNIALAKRYLASLYGTGGTQMIEGVKAALDFPHDPSRLRFVSFMTDGYIGNDRDIIAAVHERIGDARIFSFGVGTAVNRYLLEGMARAGRGAVAYLGPLDSASEIVGRFFDRISHPALTDTEIDWGGMAVSDVYPATLPDLFVGRAVVVTGKFLGHASDVTINGSRGGAGYSVAVPAAEPAEANSQVARIWARLRIADLADRQAQKAGQLEEIVDAIRRTALKYQLMSDYTSFVAVDTSRQTDGDYGVTVQQAVPVPEGVRYETTVQ